jgi:hypothetical protein
LHPIRALAAGLPEEAADWLRGHDDLATAWRECPRPDWLLHIAASLDVERRLIVRAAAELAAEAALAGRGADLRPRRALRTALLWLDGRAEGAAAWAHGFAAMEAAEGLEGRASDAARAAACVAFACDERADASFYAISGHAARSVAFAASALADPEGSADRVRELLALPKVLRAFELASRPAAPAALESAVGPVTDSFYC